MKGDMHAIMTNTKSRSLSLDHSCPPIEPNQHRFRPPRSHCYPEEQSQEARKDREQQRMLMLQLEPKIGSPTR